MGYQQEHLSALAIVPARWASTRLPGKPLAMIGERPMVEWVYRGAEAALGQAVVATDDQRIYDAVQAFGGRAVMTSPSHQSGTDRCAEALELLKAEGIDPEVVVNVQGYEPFVNAQNLRRLVAEFADSEVAIATLVRYFAQGEDEANPNWPKVVVDLEGNALLFSRSLIPYPRNAVYLKNSRRLKHIGVYAFRPSVLQQVSGLMPTPLEQIEGLEQLRWLQHGYRIRTVRVEEEGLSVDTPQDLEWANRWAKERG